MSVNPADSPTHEAVALNKRQHLIVAAHRHTWQALKQQQYFRAAMQRAARQFANDERVAFNFFPAEQGTQRRVAPAEMIHPDRGINQHDGYCAAVVGVGGVAECVARCHPARLSAGRSPGR
jgi:hypothetical protein